MLTRLSAYRSCVPVIVDLLKVEQQLDVHLAQGERFGGKAVWEDTAEKREASLQERKAKMILLARQYDKFLSTLDPN